MLLQDLTFLRHQGPEFRLVGLALQGCKLGFRAFGVVGFGIKGKRASCGVAGMVLGSLGVRILKHAGYRFGLDLHKQRP